MKKFVVLFICLSMAVVIFGQEKSKEIVAVPEVEVNQPRFTGVKNVTEFVDGTYSMDIYKYMAKHIVYPEQAAKCYKEGTEVVKFVVTPPGNVTDIEVVNSICPEIDKEIERVLAKTDGMWLPALIDGTPKPMEKEISMVFCIDRYNNMNICDYFTKKATADFKKGTKKLLISKNANKALKHFDHGLTYLPYDKSLLYMRGLSRYELGDEEGAREDFERITKLGGFDKGFEVTQGATSLKGYAVMAELLDIK